MLRQDKLQEAIKREVSLIIHDELAGYIKISNEIMEALNKVSISGDAHQFLGVVLRKTYGFNKKEDRISTLQFMQDTGLSRLAVYRARKKLVDLNMITVYKNDDSQVLTYSFQKDYHSWRVSTKMIQNCHHFCNSQYITKDKQKTITKDNINNNNNIILSGKPNLEEPTLYLNLKAKRNFNPKLNTNKDLVRARFAEGRTIEDFKKVIDKKVKQWLTDEKMSKFLRPSTLFNRTNFENYVNEPEQEALPESLAKFQRPNA